MATKFHNLRRDVEPPKEEEKKKKIYKQSTEWENH